MSVNAKQIAAILALSPPKRYSHFIKNVVGWGEAWGLYDNGWATCESPHDRLSCHCGLKKNMLKDVLRVYGLTLQPYR